MFLANFRGQTDNSAVLILLGLVESMSVLIARINPQHAT